MRYIAKKTKKGYEVTHIKEMEQPNGLQVEVVIGKNIIDKSKLEKSIKDYQEETEIMMETRQQELSDLKNIYDAIEKA